MGLFKLKSDILNFVCVQIQKTQCTCVPVELHIYKITRALEMMQIHTVISMHFVGQLKFGLCICKQKFTKMHRRDTIHGTGTNEIRSLGKALSGRG